MITKNDSDNESVQSAQLAQLAQPVQPVQPVQPSQHTQHTQQSDSNHPTQIPHCTSPPRSRIIDIDNMDCPQQELSHARAKANAKATATSIGRKAL